MSLLGLLIAQGCTAVGPSTESAFRQETKEDTALLPTEPLLRLETGMHTATIRHIATDRDGRWLATASEDKTVRIWDATTGRLVQVLRPPIGEHQEGRLFAVALSPDGEWVAASGWTSADGRSNYVYIFRRQTGTLVKAIPGHSRLIFNLAWSPDGRFLAATLGGRCPACLSRRNLRPDWHNT